MERILNDVELKKCSGGVDVTIPSIQVYDKLLSIFNDIAQSTDKIVVNEHLTFLPPKALPK